METLHLQKMNSYQYINSHQQTITSEFCCGKSEQCCSSATYYFSENDTVCNVIGDTSLTQKSKTTSKYEYTNQRQLKRFPVKNHGQDGSINIVNIVFDKKQSRKETPERKSIKKHGQLSQQRRRQRVQTTGQRKAANVRERKRMCNLNQAFDALKACLPNMHDCQKFSRIQTLRAAIVYISLLSTSLKL